MRPRFVLLATAAASVLVAVPSTGVQRAPRPVAFDPLFATGAACAPARAGRPALLDHLMLAQVETRPFQPGQQPPAKAPPAQAGPPPLYDDLGTLHVPITTRNPKAQAFFDQGMRLSFAFNHAEAARAFRAAQALDPACAMCYWGEALALGPNINAPMFPEAVAPAVQAAARATRLARGATPVEQALIRAVARRYSADPGVERAALDKAYADAMTEAARAHPNNDTVQVLFAESLMDLAPWDYWASAGTQPKNRTAEMVDALERVLERNPSHPGAAHYYIHAMEASAHPDKALPAARVLARQIPGAGHIVHMPSHIYYRLGMYREALQSNVEAIAIDEKYFSGSPSDPVYRGAYYPHNIHFVMVSALMGGDGKTTLDAAGKLDQAVGPDVVKAIGALQPVKAAPYFAHVQFSSPDVLVALPDPGSDLVLVKAMWHYARAIGHVRKGSVDAANREIAAIDRIERSADFKPLTDWAIPAREIVQTARAVARGRVADKQGKLPEAIAAYREAVAIQDALPYMEPPYWYYPVRQSLGVALLRAGQLDGAEQVFRTSLARTPSNGWALRGLMEVYRVRGDTAALAAAQQRFAKTWLGKPEGPALSSL
ncbi:tetratricopeptide repeat protein [Massilia niastensis]|uniref:tetratricopeptide repeat protein n=1 Tax=Massilia niastensis TaxID=544911 RepID=UPI0004757CCC|nr:tetratricopeptide repeat protein [Massilia niastensis]